MPAAAAPDDVDRQLPAGDEIFLDHVAHFVRDAAAAGRALERAGFAPTPISIQVASRCGRRHATDRNRQCHRDVFARLYRSAVQDRRYGARPRVRCALARHAGLHLAAFAVADAAKAHRRLATAGFRVRDLVRMQRPVETEAGAGTASFTIARVEPEMMPEGRIQMLTHHTEQAVWQQRWLSHPNSALGLIDVVIAVADVEEAAQRFARFTGRAATPTPGGALIHLDRGGVYLVTHDRATEKLPEVAITALPFIVGYALRVQSLAAAEAAVERAGLEWRAIDDGVVATFPAELGEGAWFFVESAAALPWRR